ncbi:hypothetical protein [Ekhidna sp.]|uniref:hypothetical protein n=1 Tax=Ekhidna sp. TaxID=2608089 RepID=UPI003B59D63E
MSNFYETITHWLKSNKFTAILLVLAGSYLSVSEIISVTNANIQLFEHETEDETDPKISRIASDLTIDGWSSESPLISQLTKYFKCIEDSTKYWVVSANAIDSTQEKSRMLSINNALIKLGENLVMKEQKATPLDSILGYGIRKNESGDDFFERNGQMKYSRLESSGVTNDSTNFSIFYERRILNLELPNFTLSYLSNLSGTLHNNDSEDNLMEQVRVALENHQNTGSISSNKSVIRVHFGESKDGMEFTGVSQIIWSGLSMNETLRESGIFICPVMYLSQNDLQLCRVGLIVDKEIFEMKTKYLFDKNGSKTDLSLDQENIEELELLLGI